MALPFIWAQQNFILQQDNTQLHVVGIAWTFLDTENVQLLPWPADILPVKKVEPMVAEQLAHHHIPVTAVNEL